MIIKCESENSGSNLALPLSGPYVILNKAGSPAFCIFRGRMWARTRPTLMSLQVVMVYDSNGYFSILPFSSVQFSCSVVSDSLRPHELQHAMPPCPSPNSRSSPKLMSIESVMPSSNLILCHPLLLLPLIPPSIRVFSNESTLCMRWPKYWSFSFSISPSKEHLGLILPLVTLILQHLMKEQDILKGL